MPGENFNNSGKLVLSKKFLKRPNSIYFIIASLEK